MTPHNKLSARANQAKGLVRGLMARRTGGHGHPAAPGAHTGRSPAASDLRRAALKARERLRK